MPSKKVLTILIICFGVVVSVWIFEKQTGISIAKKIPEAPAASSTRPTIVGVNWESILSSSTKNSVTVISGIGSDSQKNSKESYPGEGTLTDQVSKDFFSRYLNAPKDENGNITSTQADQIANDVLASGNYSSISAPVYSITNLNLNPNSDKATLQKYYDDMVKIQKVLSSVDKSSYEIVDKAVTDQNEKELAQIDPIINTYKKAEVMLLTMSVPTEAAKIHLDDINTISVMIAEFEAMRNTFNDPVRSFIALNNYETAGTNFYNAVKNTVLYFISKGFSAPN